MLKFVPLPCDVFEKNLIFWKAFQVKNWNLIYMENIAIEVYLVDKLHVALTEF